MQLQSQTVELGDTVYDLLEGGGVVTSIGDTTITVNFGSVGLYIYNSAGQRLGNTPSRFPVLLYWQNPIVMIPVRNEERWNSMKTLFLNAYQIIKDL